GILGGGQLGKMLALAAHNWQTPVYILDAAKDFPAGQVATHFVEGSFKDETTVYEFGQRVDILTVEIEHVNTAALIRLQDEGKTVHPNPHMLNIIKDKGLQKQFYAQHQLPTSSFELFDDATAIRQALDEGRLQYPFVQKARTAGYDGNGVAIIRQETDRSKLLEAASVIEPLVPIKKEIAVVVARNASGEIKTFPPVEMEFHPTANLVEFLSCPAEISPTQVTEAESLARSVIEAYGICGLLAVELFLTETDEWLINEVAPRPHNSGHHTIDSCVTSQFEQHLRAILDLPLGDTSMKTPSVMINLLGAAGATGPTQYYGLEQCLAIPGAKFHLYGKTITKPFRKMGHATILDADLDVARKKASQIQERLKIST
ncbi:MAG: 5-(carboxyamino)imidazole ribonucleotide synthase, partial [Bacteroidota bacterium]